MKEKNIYPIYDDMIQRKDREKRLGQKGFVLWLTGLSGSGKSTIAIALEKRLFEEGFIVQLLDGDNIRTGISNNLNFKQEDRRENIRRIAEVSKLFVNSGFICINAFISPTKEIRALAEHIIGKDDYNEIYVNTPLSVCENRDVKGLYKKVRKGEISGFSGIDAPYESPLNPALSISTTDKSIEQNVEELYQYLKERKLIPERQK